MTNFLSDPFENATVSSVDVVNSEDGAYRFGNENLASFNFDGAVPTVLDDAFEAQYLEPGMYFVVPGTDDTLRSVVEVSLDEDDPLDEMTIVYVGENSLLSTHTCDGSDLLTVQYESWDERVLGTQGWTITAGGNAIFSNVAVRGRIEATEGYISGTVVIGSSEVPADDIASIDDLDGYIPDGQAANDIVTNATTITGGNISTGRINSSGYNGPATGGGSFSTVGSQFNLDDGTIVAPNFRIDNTGNAFFRGNVTGSQFSTSSTIDGSDFGTGRVSIKNSFSGFDGPILEIRNFSTLGPNNSLVRIGMVQRNSFVSDLFFSSQGADFIFDGSIDATSFDGSGFALTNLNPANISAGTAGISITGNAATATTATTATSATSAGGLTGTPSISVSGLVNNFAGTTYLSPANFTNPQTNLEVRLSDGRIGRQSSTLDIKENIASLTGEELSIVPKNKSASISKINPDSIFNITPIEYVVIEDENKNTQIGFLVEDLLENYPQAVTYNGDIPSAYNTNPIVAGLVYAVKTLKKELEDLQSRVLQLESQLGG